MGHCYLIRKVVAKAKAVVLQESRDEADFFEPFPQWEDLRVGSCTASNHTLSCAIFPIDTASV